MEVIVKGTMGVPRGGVLSIKVGTTKRQAPATRVGHTFKFANSPADMSPMTVELLVPAAQPQVHTVDPAAEQPGSFVVDFGEGAKVTLQQRKVSPQPDALGMTGAGTVVAGTGLPERVLAVAQESASYLEKHDLVCTLQEVLHEILLNQPANPKAYMEEYFGSRKKTPQQLEEERRLKEAEERRKQAEKERKEREMEAKRQQEEEARKRQEEEERQRKEAEEREMEEKRKQEEEARKRQEEEERQRKEAEEREREERRKQAEEARKRKEAEEEEHRRRVEARAARLRRMDPRVKEDLRKMVSKLKAASYTKGGKDWTKLFHEQDKDHSGEIGWEEFYSMCRRVLKLTEEEKQLRKLFRTLDEDDSGQLNIAEVVELVEGLEAA